MSEQGFRRDAFINTQERNIFLMASFTDVQNQVIELYIGTFNRAPDSPGLSFWVNQILESGLNINEVAEAMFASEEVATTYPADQTLEAFVEKIYQNVLGRSADGPGMAYWVSELSNGLSRDRMIMAIIDGAKAASGGAADASVLENRTEVARHFTLQLGLEDFNLSSEILSQVDYTEDSLGEALDALSLYSDSLDSALSVIEGTPTDDILNGDENANHIYALGGEDTINAGEGDNYIYAGIGDDNIYTGSGADSIFARAGDDTIYSGDGDDVVYGNSGNDSLHLEAGDDEAYGGGGDDFIYGYDGNDFIKGEDGNDTIFAGAGSNTVYGGAGHDTITTGDDGNFVDAGAGRDSIYGGAGTDRIYGGEDDDIIYGQAGNDVLEGHSGVDVLYGGAGNDLITGSEGQDTLIGGAGNDTLNGEEDNDRIEGSVGSDILIGGGGEDTFVFTQGDSTTVSLDTVVDFNGTPGSDQDMIEFIGPITGASQATFINTAIDAGTAVTLQEATNLAAGLDGSLSPAISWFVFEENTYVLLDASAAVAYDTNTDVLIKIQGIQDLETDLSQLVLFS